MGPGALMKGGGGPMAWNMCGPKPGGGGGAMPGGGGRAMLTTAGGPLGGRLK